MGSLEFFSSSVIPLSFPASETVPELQENTFM